MSRGRRLCWDLKVDFVLDRLPIGPPADVNLRQVVAARRAKVHVDLETGLAKDLRKIGSELSKHRVSNVSARMANPGGAVVEHAIRTGHDSCKRLGYAFVVVHDEDRATWTKRGTRRHAVILTEGVSYGASGGLAAARLRGNSC